MLLMNSKNWVAWTIEYGIAGRLDQGLLDELRQEVAGGRLRQVAALGQLLRADDRQRDVVADAGGRLRGQQVAGRRREEVERRRVLEVGRVRHVDDDRRAVERRGEAFAGDRVDAKSGRGRDRLVALLGELGDDLRADEPGAADDDDLHSEAPPHVEPGTGVDWGLGLGTKASVPMDARWRVDGHSPERVAPNEISSWATVAPAVGRACRRGVGHWAMQRDGRTRSESSLDLRNLPDKSRRSCPIAPPIGQSARRFDASPHPVGRFASSSRPMRWRARRRFPDAALPHIGLGDKPPIRAA